MQHFLKIDLIWCSVIKMNIPGRRNRQSDAKETGRKFTEILLEKRMERAALLLRNTTLSIEEISSLLGYSNHSNFFKAFKEYYKKTPREYLRE